MENIVSASVLGCDLARLGAEADRAAKAGAKWLHFDVMDGLFVNNISLGIPLLSSVRKHTDMFVDTHLMICDPIRYIDAFADAGSDNITFHVEAAKDAAAVIEKIHSRGIAAGISVKPGTPVAEIKPYIGLVDLVLVMTVEPGFGGQGFIKDTLQKIKQCRALIDDSGRNIRLEVDGGINAETALRCRQAGADTFVSGTYLFNSEDISAAVKNIIG
ncbi:MAG: ribulose-phosphate 3-epimerase [Ruminococcus sp.]|nr:ribulose-phosphate 3-epimerase [Ruminococcus sp.]